MNNRYIFRGKGNPKYNDGEWYYGHLIYDGSDYQIVDPEYGSCKRTVIPETVEQCSGVPDKSGKLMFEGDVVNALLDFGMPIKLVCAFRDGSFGLLAKQHGAEHFHPFTSLCNISYEIIGNIHGNKELLDWSDTKMTDEQINIMLDDGAKMPNRAHDMDAGLDLFSRETKVIPARGSAIFDTGVHIELSPNTVGFLKSKSGLNVKHGILSEGVIDVGYMGSIVAKLYNNSDTDYEVKNGDKITQLVILPILTPKLNLVAEFDKTDRGVSGFGSTGR